MQEESNTVSKEIISFISNNNQLQVIAQDMPQVPALLTQGVLTIKSKGDIIIRGGVTWGEKSIIIKGDSVDISNIVCGKELSKENYQKFKENGFININSESLTVISDKNLEITVEDNILLNKVKFQAQTEISLTINGGCFANKVQVETPLLTINKLESQTSNETFMLCDDPSFLTNQTTVIDPGVTIIGTNNSYNNIEDGFSQFSLNE